MSEKAAPTNTPVVSIVVRFGNDREHLGETLRAVRAQAPIDGPIEIIAVDNESIDRSRDIASQYANQILTISDYKHGKSYQHRNLPKDRGARRTLRLVHEIEDQ